MNTQIVTGVAGFIGSHLAETLLKQRISVVGIDQFNDYYDPQLKQKNIVNLLKFSNFKLIKADIEELDCSQILKSIEVIYYQAAQAGVRASWGESFSNYTTKNINATQIILEGAKQAKTLKRIVYALAG